MKLKFEAQISTGNLRIYDENDMNSSLYEVNVNTEDKEHFKMEVSDKAGNLLTQVLYNENMDRKWLIVNDYIIDNLETCEKINVKAERGKQLVIGDDNEMYLKYSIRDRKMTLCKNDKHSQLNDKFLKKLCKISAF